MVPVDRIQTGVRLERHLVKVLKALAAYLDLSLGDLIEGIALHAFEGRAPFKTDTLAQIDQLRSVYGLTITADDSHLLVERNRPDHSRTRSKSVARRRRIGAT
jgi:hypothetical protein